MDENKVIETPVDSESIEVIPEVTETPEIDELNELRQMKNKLGKELGVNLFKNDEAVKELKKLIDSQKSKEELEAEERQKLNQELDSYRQKESQWEFEKLANNIDLDLDKSKQFKLLFDADKSDNEESNLELAKQIVKDFNMSTIEVKQETVKVNQLGMDLGQSNKQKPSELKRAHDAEYSNSPYYKG